MDLHTILIMGHVIGTILGVGGATIAEVQINVALKDRKVDTSERALMHANYWMIRVGLALIVISGIALVWTLYQSGSTWALTSPKLWTKEIMAGIILLNAVLLSYRLVPLWLGAAISFTSWWGAALLGLTGRLPFTFTEFLIGYVVAVFIVAGVLHLIRHQFIGRRSS
jgi:hypothetical protein